VPDKSIEQRVEEIVEYISILEKRLDKVEGKSALDFDWKIEIGFVIGIFLLGLGSFVYFYYF
jgi:hypothetical protein